MNFSSIDEIFDYPSSSFLFTQMIDNELDTSYLYTKNQLSTPTNQTGVSFDFSSEIQYSPFIWYSQLKKEGSSPSLPFPSLSSVVQQTGVPSQSSSSSQSPFPSQPTFSIQPMLPNQSLHTRSSLPVHPFMSNQSVLSNPSSIPSQQPSMPNQPSYSQQPSFPNQPSYSQQPSLPNQPSMPNQPSYSQQTSIPTLPSFPPQPSYTQQPYPSQPSLSNRPSFPIQPSYSSQRSMSVQPSSPFLAYPSYKTEVSSISSRKQESKNHSHHSSHGDHIHKPSLLSPFELSTHQYHFSDNSFTNHSYGEIPFQARYDRRSLKVMNHHTTAIEMTCPEVEEEKEDWSSGGSLQIETRPRENQDHQMLNDLYFGLKDTIEKEIGEIKEIQKVICNLKTRTSSYKVENEKKQKILASDKTLVSVSVYSDVRRFILK